MGSPPRCLAVEGDFDARRDGSLLYVAALVSPDADSADVERALLGGSEKIASTPPEDPELDAAKRGAELRLMLDEQTSRGRGQSLGFAEAVYGDRRAAAGRLQRLRELTPADVMRAASEILRPERRSVVWLLPGGMPAGAGAKGGAR